MNFWLIKSEPFKYSWAQLLDDKKTFWDGVRNYQARNNLKAMKKGDFAFFYHSNEGMEIVGIAKIVKEYYQDPTIEDDKWVAVDVAPYKTLKKKVTLSEMKNTLGLENLSLIKQGRLSVCPISDMEFKIILNLAETKI